MWPRSGVPHRFSPPETSGGENGVGYSNPSRFPTQGYVPHSPVPSTSRAMMSSPNVSPFPLQWQPLHGTAPMQPHTVDGLTYKPIFTRSPADQSIGHSMGPPVGQWKWFAEDPMLQAEFVRTPPAIAFSGHSPQQQQPLQEQQLLLQQQQRPAKQQLLQQQQQRPAKQQQQQRPAKQQQQQPPVEVESKAKKREVVIPKTMRVLSGSVDKVLKWARMNDNIQVLFEVIGPVASVRHGSSHFEKVVLLKEEAGPALQCVFYEIDRPLCALQQGQQVRCVGRMVARNKLQAFCMAPATAAQRSAMQRLAFICQRTVQELTVPEPSTSTSTSTSTSHR